MQRWIRQRFGTFRGLVRFALGNLEYRIGRVSAFSPAKTDLPACRRLVFVCLGNICRSAYAEHRALQLELPCASLGLSTATGQPAFRLAIEAARRRGVDLDEHKATDLSDFDLRSGDLLLAMEIRQAKRLAAMRLPSGVGVALLGAWARPLRVHIHDPYELEPSYFDTCFDVIDDALEGFSGAWNRSRACGPGDHSQ